MMMVQTHSIIAPHLVVYQAQVGSVYSIWNRFAGVFLVFFGLFFQFLMFASISKDGLSYPFDLSYNQYNSPLFNFFFNNFNFCVNASGFYSIFYTSNALTQKVFNMFFFQDWELWFRYMVFSLFNTDFDTTSVYKLQGFNVLSITEIEQHRFSTNNHYGDFLSGLDFELYNSSYLVAYFMCLFNAYSVIQSYMPNLFFMYYCSYIGIFIANSFGLVFGWFFFYHMFSGVRHFICDDLQLLNSTDFTFSGHILVFYSFLLSILFWYCILFLFYM